MGTKDKKNLEANKASLKRRRAGKVRPGAPNPENGEDRDQARLRQKAREVIDQTPEVRLEKVKALREAIRKGTYKVDARKLANLLIVKMIRERE
jgi:negative regulator of flagellin synthesis FlgM